ncbi:MAG TPA: hypothetical protein VF283_18665 [Bryobacteraceae bacterium]
MLRCVPALLAPVLFLTACGNSMQSKDKVQQAILSHLADHSGIDLNALEVTTTSVSFDHNMAYATVAFHPKGDTSLASEMLLKYTLQARNGRWAVVKVEHAPGQGTAGPAAGEQLPPGHPPINPMTPQGGQPQ